MEETSKASAAAGRDREDLCRGVRARPNSSRASAAAAAARGVAALVRALERGSRHRRRRRTSDAEGREIVPDPSGPVVARAIKTSIHPQSGKITIVRILSGTIKADATLTNVSRNGEKARSGASIACRGKKQEAITEAGPGSIVAIGQAPNRSPPANR